MHCDTCVEMTLTVESLALDNIRLKRMNRVLRTVNGMLRRQETRNYEAMDDVFLALCQTDKAAEVALGELWGSGEFDCGPQDYEWMVERCLEAMRKTNESRTKPAFHSDRDFGDESDHCTLPHGF